MNTPTVLASVLLASGAAITISILTGPSTESGPDPALAAARAEVRTLRDQVARLESRLDEVAVASAPSRETAVERIEAPTVSEDQIARAVESYMLRRGNVPSASGDELTVGSEATFAALDGTTYWGNEGAWKKAFAEGRMDELIDMFEEAADANPNDVDAQMALANAYMAYLQLDQTKWQMSMKADAQFDKVLAIDERHWEARFTKAVSYTFWPDFLGKKKAAVSQFEILVEQQESSPVQDHDYQTYLYLGNLLEEQDPERARAIWQRGLRRHPNNAELSAKLR